MKKLLTVFCVMIYTKIVSLYPITNKKKEESNNEKRKAA
jgi:hypothetical protein